VTSLPCLHRARIGQQISVVFEAMQPSAQGASRSPAGRQRVGQRSAAQRSRITNGKQIFPGLDMRSALARRFKDITAALVVDQGGADRLTEARF
jgi:hypothetical protein